MAAVSIGPEGPHSITSWSQAEEKAYEMMVSIGPEGPHSITLARRFGNCPTRTRVSIGPEGPHSITPPWMPPDKATLATFQSVPKDRTRSRGLFFLWKMRSSYSVSIGPEGPHSITINGLKKFIGALSVSIGPEGPHSITGRQRHRPAGVHQQVSIGPEGPHSITWVLRPRRNARRMFQSVPKDRTRSQITSTTEGV